MAKESACNKRICKKIKNKKIKESTIKNLQKNLFQERRKQHQIVKYIQSVLFFLTRLILKKNYFTSLQWTEPYWSMVRKIPNSSLQNRGKNMHNSVSLKHWDQITGLENAFAPLIPHHHIKRAPVQKVRQNKRQQSTF